MSVEVTADTVNVTWDDGSHTMLPHLWLRDNCPCSECRVEQTGEKVFLLHTVPCDLVPQAASCDHDQLNLVWPGGHVTQFAGEEIRALAVSDDQPIQLWKSEFRPNRVDYAAFIEDDRVAAEAIENFLVYGAMVLTEMPKQRDMLESLHVRLGPLREMPFARIHEVEVDPTGYNVAHTALALPPHNDFASASWPPSIQGLHMIANECPGGESIIVDGWSVAEELRRDEPEMFDVLCQVPVPHRMFSEDTETWSANPLIRLDSDGKICHLRYSNQLMQAMNPTKPKVVEFYRAYRELSRRLMASEAKAVFRLEAGHCLLVAGHRVLHAREKFEPTGARHLQDAYFEHDGLRNHLRVLRRTLAHKESRV